MKVAITVALKPGVLDPEAIAILTALTKGGHSNIQAISRSREFLVDIDETDPTRAHDAADKMARDLLANTVIETYSIDVKG